MSNSSSKSSILGAIRKNDVAPADLPSLEHAWTTYPDPVAQFASVLDSISGVCHVVDSLTDATQQIQQLPVVMEAKQIINLVPGISCDANRLIDLNNVTDPHQLADVDVAILRGEFGVAENAALWVTDQLTRHRVVYFLSQHLVAIVSASAILSNMHEAYDRLKFAATDFGMFVAGPSKTADIEQSLVIGAHGSRSMTVFIVQDTS